MRKKAKKKRGQHGGHRKNAGRPLGIRGKLKNGLFTSRQAYVYETVIIKLPSHGQIRRKRITRAKLADAFLEQLKTRDEKTYYFLLDVQAQLERSKSVEKNGDIFFNLIKFLEKRFKNFAALMRMTTPPRRLINKNNYQDIPTTEESMEEKVLRERIERWRKAEAEWLAEMERRERDGYIIDEKTGRKVSIERVWKHANGIGMGNRLEERQKMSKPIPPFWE